MGTPVHDEERSVTIHVRAEVKLHLRAPKMVRIFWDNNSNTILIMIAEMHAVQ